MFDRMSPEKLARAKGQAQTTNQLNPIARVANGFGVSRADKLAAQAKLAEQVGEKKAKRLMRDAARQARGSF